MKSTVYLTLRYKWFWMVIFIPVIMATDCLANDAVDSLKVALRESENDTLKARALIYLWEETAYSQPDSAKSYAFRSLELSRKANHTKGIADALQRIGSGYSITGINDSALYYYDKSLALYSELKDVRMEGTIIGNIGGIYYNQGEYVKAILKTEEALKKSSEANDIPGIAVSLQLLGNIHHFLGNYKEAQKYLLLAQTEIEKISTGVRYADGLVYLASNYMAQDKNEKALENLRQAIRIYEKEKDYIFLSQALNNTGYIFLEENSYDSAYQYLSRALELSRKYDNKQMEILAGNNLGDLAIKRREYKKAEKYLTDALLLANQTNDKQKIALVARKMGELKIERMQFKSAMSYYDTALIVGKETASKSSLQNTYRSLSDGWAKMGNFEKSLAYYKLSDALKDSIYNENKSRQMEEMEARYNKEKQEKEIAIQKSNIEILSKDLELQNVRQSMLIGGLIALFLIGFFIVFMLVNRMKKNRRIREQEKLLEVEKLKNTELQRDNYEKELEIKKNELTSHALQIVQKNELLKTLKDQITQLEKKSNGSGNEGYRQLKYMINGSAQTDKEWNNFNRHFERVHQGFLKNLKNTYPVLTSNDLRLSAMLKLNLNSKEIAAIMNISPESVKKARYRLRRKLDLQADADLHAFMMDMDEQLNPAVFSSHS
ncbi:MAG: tetratricopeptide repeat protein [Bacteroidales bacterium]|nr:tetratricopeptide repeat protein [Bacteroidales bacterium]